MSADSNRNASSTPNSSTSDSSPFESSPDSSPSDQSLSDRPLSDKTAARNGQAGQGKHLKSESLEGENPPDRNEWRSVYLRPGDQKELKRIVRTYKRFKSPSHVLRIYLKRGLLPRVERRDYSPKSLAREVTLQGVPRQARESTLIGLKCWPRLEDAAGLTNRYYRRLEREVSWNGSLQATPFTRFRPKMIVRAAAREIAEMSQDETAEFFRQEGVRREDVRREGLSQKGIRQESIRQKKKGQDDGDEPTYQMLSKLPGHRRGGKSVCVSITGEATGRLKQKAKQKSWENRSALLRRALRELLRWIEEKPAAAFRYVQEESPLYKEPLTQGYNGYVMRVEPNTKRRLKQARHALQNGPGQDLGRRITQREILQAAARWALERGGSRCQGPPTH